VGAEVAVYSFLTEALHAGKWLASHPDNFTAGIHYTGDWMLPRTGLGVLGEKKIPCPSQEIKIRAVQPIVQSLY